MTAQPHLYIRRFISVSMMLYIPINIAHATPQSEEDGVVLPTIQLDKKEEKGFKPTHSQLKGYENVSILDVPASVTIINRKILDEQGAIGLYDALKNVSGVVRNQQSGVAYDQLAVRGITLDNRSSYMFNGVLPFDNNLPIPMENKESIEVLKGATALSYGFVNPAGVVNLTTKRAQNHPQKTIALSTDSKGSRTIHLDLGQKFGDHDQFGIRVNGLTSYVNSPIDTDTGRRKFISLAFDWDVTDRFKLKYDYEYIKASITEQAAIVPPKAVNDVITLPNVPTPNILLSMKGKDTQSDATTHLLQSEYTFTPQWKLKSSIGQSTTTRDRWLWVFDNYNSQTGEGTVYGADQVGQKYVNTNIRSEIVGEFNTGLAQHNLSVGFSHNRLFQPSFYTYMYSASQNMYTPVVVTALKRSSTNTKKTLSDRSYSKSNDYDQGIYVQDRLSIANVDLTLGLRSGQYETEQLGTVSSKTKKTSPSASVVYKFHDHTRVYMSYMQALESVGVAPVTAVNAGSSLPAAVSTQKEFGIKSDYFNQILLSASAFMLDRKSASLNSESVYEINGTEQYRGLEFSAQGDISPSVSMVLSGMWLDAKFKTSTKASLINKTPENIPSYTINLFTTYKVQAIPNLSVNAGFVSIGRRPINDLNQAYLPASTIFSTGANYETQWFGYPTKIRLNIDNVTNKKYWSAAGSGQLAVGMPRTASLGVSLNF